MEDFSFFPPVSQFIKCDQEGECTELGDEKSVSGRSFGFSCCSPPITALYELTLQCVCGGGGGSRIGSCRRTRIQESTLQHVSSEHLIPALL